MPERSKGLDSSSSVFVLGGSNPPECKFLPFYAPPAFPYLLAISWSIGEDNPTDILFTVLLLVRVDHFEGGVAPLLASSSSSCVSPRGF